MLRFGVVAHAPFAERVERGPRRLFHRAPPLERDQRLDPCMAALAGADGMPVALPLLELVVLRQPRDDPLVGLFLRQSGELARGLVHPAVGPDHGQGRQPVVGADSEVDGVMPWCYLERARAELLLDPRVRDHRHRPLDERRDHLLADRVPIPLVVRVHGHRHVPEDRRRSDSRDREAGPPVCEGPSAKG